uniref:DNA-(apurinic or apyrimidinic site) lyase n=1 Tax=Lingulaulax polyedra TaxID=160621 RepID=A0A516AGB3_LINPO|nr:N-glycosylase/DNA lyase [Lingulodinium polyedra]
MVCSLAAREGVWGAGALKRPRGLVVLPCTELDAPEPPGREGAAAGSTAGPASPGACKVVGQPAQRLRLRCKAPAPGEWLDLRCPPAELRADCTLTPGQSFTWKRVAADQWLGVLGASAVVIRQTPSTTLVRSIAGPVVEADIRAYLGLAVPCPSLAELYRTWSAGCGRLAQVAACLPGLRVLQQDPVETLFAFICSQNNNVARIALLLDRLRASFGEPICELPPWLQALDDDGPVESGLRDLAHVREFNARGRLHRFPTLEALAAAPDAALRKLGLGYRAAYVRGAASALLERGGRGYLQGLQRCQDRLEVQRALCELPGVGPKVADCVALFSLCQHGCVPVDVHVWRIATRDYEPELRGARSLTPRVYEQVGEAFRRRFGAFAGWAHSLLFGAELAGAMRSRLPEALLADMDSFRGEEKRGAERLRAERRARRLERQAAAAEGTDGARAQENGGPRPKRQRRREGA